MTVLVTPDGGALRPRIPGPVEPSAPSRWLDRFATAGVAHLGAQAPPYLAYGVVGVMAGILTLTALGQAAGIPLTTQLALIVTSLTVFVALGLVQKALLGRERHVLWENVLLVLLACAGVGAATGLPALLVVDCQVVALGAFLAVARWGCLAHGCCHGRPSTFGIRYETGLHEDDPLTGVRLFPLPLLDAAALAVVSGVAAVLALTSAGTGAALTSWLLGYGVARFFLELARGDAREQWGPLTESQWVLVAVVAGLVGRELVHLDGDAGEIVTRLVAGGASVAVIAAAYLTRGRWLAVGPPAPTLDELGAWQDMLTELDLVAHQHRHVMTGTAPWAGRALRVDLAVDPLDGGQELHAYVVRGGEDGLDPQAAVRAGGVLLQRLPAHRLLRVDGCTHDTLAVWVAVDPRTPPGSRPGDDLRLVDLRARAAAGELLAATKAAHPVVLRAPAADRLDPQLLPPVGTSPHPHPS